MIEMVIHTSNVKADFPARRRTGKVRRKLCAVRDGQAIASVWIGTDGLLVAAARLQQKLERIEAKETHHVPR